jgi:subtilisin
MYVVASPFRPRPALALALAICVALLFCVPSTPAGASSEPPARVIVALRLPSTLSTSDPTTQRRAVERSQDAFAGTLARLGARELARARSLPLVVLEVERADLAALASDPRVAALEEDRLAAPLLEVSTGLVGAPAVWAGGQTGAGQTVVVLDTGAEVDHPFLAQGLVDGACFSTTADGQFPSTSLCPDGAEEQYGRDAGANCPAGVYGCDHGTHVAGIVAGEDLASGRFGVAPGADLVSVQVYSRFTGTPCANAGRPSPCALSWTSDQLRALDWVYGTLRQSRSVAAVNVSLGSGAYTPPCDAEYPATNEAIARLREAGIGVVTASGNGGNASKLSAPACLSNAIAVGATRASDTVATFSNSAPALALLAPGESIDSSFPGASYGTSSGTSMAAPHVAGAFALLRAAKPGAAVGELLGALADGGRPVTDPRSGLTRPRIQIDAALALLASAPPGPPSTPTPSPGEETLAFSAETLVFAEQVVGTSSAPRELVLENRSATAQQLGGIALDGDFALAGGTCPEVGVIASGASCTVAISFTPTAVGERIGSLTITGVTLASTSSVPLAGIGLASLPPQVFAPLVAR